MPDQEVGRNLTAIDPSFFVSLYVEPFSLTYFGDATDQTPAAYPASRSQALFPSLSYYSFKNTSHTNVMVDSMQDTVRRMRAKAMKLD